MATQHKSRSTFSIGFNILKRTSYFLSCDLGFEEVYQSRHHSGIARLAIHISGVWPGRSSVRDNVVSSIVDLFVLIQANSTTLTL